MAEPESPQRLPLRAYRDLLGRYLRPQSRRVALMAALLLTGIALRLANPRIIGYFLDAAQSGGARGPLLIAGVLFVTFALLQLAMSLAAGYVAQSVGWAATLRLRADLALHCLRLDMPFHAAHTPGELIDRIEGDAGTLAHFLSALSIDIAGNGLLVAGIIVMLALTNPWAGAGMLVYALATLLVLNRIQNLAVPRWAAQRAAQSRLYGYIEERISGAEELQAAGAQPHALRQLHVLLRPFVATTRAALVYSGLAHNLTQLVYVLGYAAGLAIGVLLYPRGQATLGTAYLITYYVGMLSEPLQAIRAELQDLQQAAASIQRIRALLAERPAVEGGTRPLPAGPLGVALEDVSFAYRPAPAPASDDNPDAAAVPAEAIPALSEVTLDVAPGRVLGVLGRTGSGKSTLTRLLVRLYTPDEGTIRLGDPTSGGIDLREVPLASLRARVGMVTQDVQLFQASLRDNLTFFDPAISDERLEVALRTLHLWGWVQSLPRGLDTPLGAGQGLSAGDAQLLALARVFLRDPGLVILDEASSRLDPATEALVEQAVDQLLHGRTGLVIAHRLATVERADDILILEEGRVVEYGARATLAADPGSRLSALLRTGLDGALA